MKIVHHIQAEDHIFVKIALINFSIFVMPEQYTRFARLGQMCIKKVNQSL